MDQEQSPQSNYYAIIPADVRYCKDLEPNAKLLYGEITALTNKHGYCWATNQYFADLYEVDSRTIRRWVESLAEKEFIFILIEQNGFNTQRKIFIDIKIKEKFTGGQKCPKGGQKCPPGEDKNVLHNTTPNITSKNCSVSAPPVGASDDEKKPTSGTLTDHIKIQKKTFDGKIIEVSKNDFFLKCVNTSGSWTTDEIDVAWNVFINYSESIRDWWKLLTGILKMNRKTGAIKNINEKEREEWTKQNLQKENLAEKDLKRQQEISNEGISRKGTWGRHFQTLNFQSTL